MGFSGSLAERTDESGRSGESLQVHLVEEGIFNA